MPPRIPCTITVPNAANPSHCNQRRFSTRQVHTARMIVSTPTNSATMRWLCSYSIPPTMCGILYHDPKLVGQSGTERPASLLVTSAPATINSNVTQEVKMAKRCSPRWYGIAIDFRSVPTTTPVDAALQDASGCTHEQDILAEGLRGRDGACPVSLRDRRCRCRQRRCKPRLYNRESIRNWARVRPVV